MFNSNKGLCKMKDGILAPVADLLKKAGFQRHYVEFPPPNTAKEGAFLSILAAILPRYAQAYDQ